VCSSDLVKDDRETIADVSADSVGIVGPAL
jgi:hypothetical protein